MVEKLHLTNANVSSVIEILFLFDCLTPISICSGSCFQIYFYHSDCNFENSHSNEDTFNSFLPIVESLCLSCILVFHVREHASSKGEHFI